LIFPFLLMRCLTGKAGLRPGQDGGNEKDEEGVS